MFEHNVKVHKTIPSWQLSTKNAEKYLCLNIIFLPVDHAQVLTSTIIIMQYVNQNAMSHKLICMCWSEPWVWAGGHIHILLKHQEGDDKIELSSILKGSFPCKLPYTRSAVIDRITPQLTIMVSTYLNNSLDRPVEPTYWCKYLSNRSPGTLVWPCWSQNNSGTFSFIKSRKKATGLFASVYSV